MPKTKKKPRAKYKKGAVRTQTTYTQKDVYLLARKHGATPAQAVLVSAVVMAESGGRVRALNTSNSNGTWDAGLGQINSIHGYSQAQLFNPDTNMEAIKKISGGFKNFSPWVAYNSGAYRKFMAKKDALLKAKGKPPTGGAKAPPVSAEQAAAAASFVGGLPGTTLTGNDIPLPGMPSIPGFDNPALPNMPDELGDFGDILDFPIEVRDAFKNFSHLFEAKFWYQTGKVILGVGALVIGLNALVKLTTGVDPIKSAANAATLAATKGKGKGKG